MRDGELDVALIALPYATDGLDVRVLVEDELFFACHRAHRLAKETAVALEDLVEEPLMLLEEGHCLRGHTLDALPLDNPRAQFEATSLHTLVQMVGAGVGVALLPKLALDADITDGTAAEVVRLAFPAARQIALVWRNTSARSEAFNLLASEVMAFVTGDTNERH